MFGLGGVVHFAPALKYSLMSSRYALYSKKRARHAIGASMISSPITVRISRGIAAYIPEVKKRWNVKGIIYLNNIVAFFY